MAGILHALDQRRLIDSNGIADGGSIAFYTTGTLTPATIYSDAALTTPRANPVVVAAGAAVPDIYLDDAVTYRRIITYPDGSTDDADPYSAPWATRAELENITGGGVSLPPTTSSSTGVITKGGARFIHDYAPEAGAGNTFAGLNAGNFTMGGGSLLGVRNTGFGFLTLNSNTTATLNTAVGYRALQVTTTGSVNTAVGADAMAANATGEYNNAFGCKALAENTTGSRNNAFGQSAMFYSLTGNDNCAFGQDTLIVNASGNNNSAYGNRAMTALKSGSDNCAFGNNALYASTASNCNAFGKNALFTNTTGTDNCAFGLSALHSNTTGGYNCSIGQYSLYGNTTGSYNVALGHRAGYGGAGDEATTVDTYCTFIGPYAGRSSVVPTATVITNSTAIGNGAQVSASNQVAIGNTAVTSLKINNTATIGGTGAQTINKPAGSVNFAASATSLVVTSSAVTANSIIIATVNTNDSTMKSVAAVAAAGSFELFANAAPTATTRVSFLVIN